MRDAFRTIAEPSAARITRSKSRFLSFLLPVSSHEAIEKELAVLKKTYHDASHICLAYRLLSGPEPLETADDAGEPAGSAGEPILRRLRQAEIHDVLAAVVRYFGGIKLGIGGLIRAYSEAAEEALASAHIVTRVLEIEISIDFPPELTSGVMGTIHRHAAAVRHIEYDAAGRAVVALPPSRVDPFVSALRDATGAQARVDVQDTSRTSSETEVTS